MSERDTQLADLVDLGARRGAAYADARRVEREYEAVSFEGGLDCS